MTNDFGSNPTGPRSRSRRLVTGLVTLALAGGVIAGCGDDEETESASTTKTTAEAAGFTPSPGTDIPKVDIKFAMWPYGDTTIAVPGIEQGWFEEAGITLPNGKETRTIKQVQQQLLNNQLDIGSGYVPNTIQTYATAPQLKMVHLQNSYIGNYIWSNPKNGDKTFEDIKSGMEFDEAAKTVITQMKGKKVALSDSGSNREFFNTILKMGGLTTKDLGKFDVVSDTKIVQLAKAGSIDYAFPAGAAQSVEVQDLGFVETFAFLDMIDGLPKGDPRVMNGVGHAGIQATQEYIDGNRETLLRFMSVFYRIIDDLQNKPKEILKYSLPTLSTATGTDLTLDQAVALFEDFYGTLNFEQTADFLLNKDYNLYYDMVYSSQIKAAKDGGILPKDKDVTPDDMIVMKGLYQDLVSLKEQYDALLKSDKPTGELADKAATFYEHRNYLDAYRYLKAASEQ
ncbi:MAG: ABC transporter substrate-binding protein [Solirubrobacteraceae bacterium]|nr:ABC transporter substrate-binding protein [Solirubrobacteraceae bacterium]